MKIFSGSKLTTSLFFFLAFTFAFFTFSIGTSALKSQSKKISRLSGEKNKLIYINCKKQISSEMLCNTLADYKVTIQLDFFKQEKNMEDSYTITTILKENSFSRLDELKYGKYLSTADYTNPNCNLAVFSNSLTQNKTFKVNEFNNENIIELSEKGRTYETIKQLVVSNTLFTKLSNSPNINNPNISIIFSGEKTELNNTISTLTKFIKSLDENGTVEIADYALDDANFEYKNIIKISILVFLITFINSISISYLWVENNKFELVIRKICCATDFDIYKTFFEKLIVIAGMSLITAIGIQYFLSKINLSFLINMNISLTLSSVINLILISFLLILVTTLPALFYIEKVQPIWFLKED